MPAHLILLAAGQGTRMQSDRPKILHEVGGLPLFVHALRSAAPLQPESQILVVGHGGEAVAEIAAAFGEDVKIAVQDEQLGTGHAVQVAQPALEGKTGDAIVLYGDTPFLSGETLERMRGVRQDGADIVVLGFEAADPGRYGRLVLDGDTLEAIVEWKDATEDQRQITTCNSGIVMADMALLFDLLGEVTNENAQGEYYLTDVPGLARAQGLTAKAVICDEAETLGVNSRADLAAAEAAFQARARADALDAGVTLTAPETVFFSHDTVIGRDALIEPNVVFGPGVTIETGAHIRAFSHLEGCHVSTGAIVGPYARLRPGAELGNGSRVGNFCEVKNAEIGEGAKVNHLSYVGDARVGEKSNIGAGTITCNYDGVFKHHTEIGKAAFIGSNTMLVAPVTVGDRAMTASGSVITRDVPAGDLAVARGRQENKAGFATRLMDKLKAAKAARDKG